MRMAFNSLDASDTFDELKIQIFTSFSIFFFYGLGLGLGWGFKGSGLG